MLTQFFNSINWVDVALVLVLVRVVFVSVKTGFIPEVFRFLGIFFALFVSLHFYAYAAALVIEKASLPLESWKFIFFSLFTVAIILVFKFLRDGVMLLFKVETTHAGFDKYAAGVLGAVRSVFLVSLIIFGLLLVRHEYVQRQTLSSKGYQLTAQIAPRAYSFLFHNFVGKLFETEKFNEDVFAVVGPQAPKK